MDELLEKFLEKNLKELDGGIPGRALNRVAWKIPVFFRNSRDKASMISVGFIWRMIEIRTGKIDAETPWIILEFLQKTSEWTFGNSFWKNCRHYPGTRLYEKFRFSLFGLHLAFL